MIDIKQKLYSNRIKDRLEGATDFEDNSLVRDIINLRPHYWFGSANAWLVFLGISLGNSAPKGKEDISNYQSQISFSKLSNHLLSFQDKNGFWNEIRNYIKDFFPYLNEEDSIKLTVIGNLITPQEGNSINIIKSLSGLKDLQEGSTKSLKAISIIKPKIIICLQKQVYELMYKAAQNECHTIAKNDQILNIESGLKNNIVYKIPVTFFKSNNGLWNKWVLTRMPMHPSRSNFYNKENLRTQFFESLKILIEEFLNSNNS